GSGISPTTLSAHLERLVGLGIVKRRVDASTRPPSVFYSLAEPLEEGGRPLHYAAADLPARLTVVAKTDLSVKDLYKEFCKAGIKVDLFAAMAELLAILLRAGPGGRRPEGSAQEGAEGGSSEQRLEEAHARADELLDGIIRPHIHRLLEDLEELGEERRAVLEEVLHSFSKKWIEAKEKVEELGIAAAEVLRTLEAGGSPQNP
ncbi:MAG: hypothetical protein QXW19_03190, partial [Candidatus Bathyarchaeia archaeon]